MSNNWRDIVENLKYYCAYCGHEVFQEQRQDIFRLHGEHSPGVYCENGDDW
ncbi:MAG: hypothetical protein AB7Y74_04805 [Syntrophorhabdus sp.]